MMELVPQKVEDAVIFSLAKGCHNKCDDCGELAVSMHNLLLSSELKYVIIDLQDEKHVCDSFPEQVIQLWKRLRIPFLFAGAMPSVEKILSGHGYFNFYQTYLSGEEAIAALRAKQPELFSGDLSGIELNVPMVTPRSRALAAGEADDEEEE